MSHGDSIKFEPMETQIDVKEDDSHSWAIDVKKVPTLYDLPKPLELL